MKNLYFLVIFGFSQILYSQIGGIFNQSFATADNYADNFMDRFNIPGMTIALAKDGKLKYMRSFGYVDKENNITTQPYNLFRIASVSKPITSVGIMKLMEEGKLALSDQVFGPGGILQDHPDLNSSTYTDARINTITVQELLEHTAGFNRDQDCFPTPTPPYPWHYSGCDPIAVPLYITQHFDAPNPAREELLVRFLLEKGLDFDPGTAYSYSNMGYLILGEIIETLTGMSYEEYFQTQILRPLGIYDMEMGKNLPENFNEREGKYYGENYTTLSCYGTGETVPWEYGGFNIEAMDAHGGWIATAKDMVKFLVAVDGFDTKPDILQPETINTMVTPSSTITNGYAKGWQVNSANNWWHTGALDGTASEWVRSAGGYTWVILLNTRRTDYTASNFWNNLDNLGWQIVSSVTNWPDYDLMLSPNRNASDLTASEITENSVKLNWTNGDGQQRMIIARPANAEKAFPKDGEDYTANKSMTEADDLGNGNMVVYQGTGNTTVVEGLAENTQYVFRVVEFNKSTATGDNALYLLGKNPELAVSTASLGLNTSEQAAFKIYPNPVHDKLIIKINSFEKNLSYECFSLNGKLIKTGNLDQVENSIDLSQISHGIYFVRLVYKNKTVQVTKFIVQ